MAPSRDNDHSALALFAAELQAARTRAGMSQDELAARIIGVHEGLLGAFVIADFATSPSIVYLETALTGLVVERPEDVSAVTLR
jgi:uncharacterized protein DUF5753